MSILDRLARAVGLGQTTPPPPVQLAPGTLSGNEARPPQDTLQLLAQDGRQAPEVQQVARVALSLPALSSTAAAAVQTATLTALSGGVPGPLSASLASVALKAIEALPQRQERARVARHYLEAIGQTDDLSGASERATNITRIVTLQDDGAAAAYEVALRSMTAPPPDSSQRQGVDTRVSPDRDFFTFANGAWLREHSIPAGKGGIRRWDEAQTRADQLQQQILEEAVQARNPPHGSDTQMLADFYRSAVDLESRNRQGLAPVQPYLDRIAQAGTPGQLGSLLAQLHSTGFSGLLLPWGSTDGEGGRCVGIWPGALSLTSKESYSSSESWAVRERDAMLGYAQSLFAATGANPQQASLRAQQVLALEQRLAVGYPSAEESRVVEKPVKVTAEELDAMAPGVGWKEYLAGLPCPPGMQFTLPFPGYLKHLARVLRDTPPEQMQDYLRFRLLADSASFLSGSLEDVQQQFNRRLGRTGFGPNPQDWPREKTRMFLNDAISRKFVAATVSEGDRQRVETLFENLKAAFAERLKEADWLSDGTRQEALEKLKRMQIEVGGPAEELRPQLDLRPDSHMQNVINLSRESMRRNLSGEGPSLWDVVRPTEVNAAYHADRNVVTVTAGFLQPPLYDRNADDAHLYGLLGSIVGHEITHGFDDQGSKFDASGRIGGWWEAQDWQRFQTRVQGLVDQAGAFETGVTDKMKGPLVAGEATADLGGVNLSMDAYLQATRRTPRQNIGGFTPEQRFYLAYASYHSLKMERGSRENWVRNEVHPVDEFRVNQILRNVPAFSAAFGLAPTASMALGEAHRAAIW